MYLFVCAPVGLITREPETFLFLTEILGSNHKPNHIQPQLWWGNCIGTFQNEFNHLNDTTEDWRHIGKRISLLNRSYGYKANTGVIKIDLMNVCRVAGYLQ